MLCLLSDRYIDIVIGYILDICYIVIDENYILMISAFKVKWSSPSPLDSHQFSWLVASPHQHTAVGAIPQLPQGGVAIHHHCNTLVSTASSLSWGMNQVMETHHRSIHQMCFLLTCSSGSQLIFHWKILVWLSQHWAFASLWCKRKKQISSGTDAII